MDRDVPRRKIEKAEDKLPSVIVCDGEVMVGVSNGGNGLDKVGPTGFATIISR